MGIAAGGAVLGKASISHSKRPPQSLHWAHDVHTDTASGSCEAGVVSWRRRSRWTIVQNPIFSPAVTSVLVTLALTAEIPLPLDVVGHEESTIIVVLNGWHGESRETGGILTAPRAGETLPSHPASI
jgi:hypothetical protein